jgi:hypothetical protein
MQSFHNFNDSLAASHGVSDLPIWEEIYRKSFPDFLMMADHRQDGEHQRAGIDRSVILENSKQLLIDEKYRFKDYSDIALEYLSNDRTGALGWVCKPLRCDYIAYAIGPIGMCYLLPVIQLQQAWARKGEFWKRTYFNPVAPNRNYNTRSVAVPVNDLFAEIGRALRVEFTKTNKVAA